MDFDAQGGMAIGSVEYRLGSCRAPTERNRKFKGHVENLGSLDRHQEAVNAF
jgi:hypothetical protein